MGALGNNALHIAAWRNNFAIVKALIEAGADVNVPDEESGWTALHKALYFGNIRIASLILSVRGDLEARDALGRTPLDLLSLHLEKVRSNFEVHGHVFAWGNGSNFTLGTGSTDIQLMPTRVDALHMDNIMQVSAAKFHSAAVTSRGKLYTWGWGLGGRLGHPEAHIHSGSSAVIEPRMVAALDRYIVTAVSAAKHHTLICTSRGEVFSMGSNRHGQLGYPTGDTQAEPRRISSLRGSHVISIAAANKHSVAVTADGKVYTWGSNSCGQLGYGAFDSSSSSNPRVVEALIGRMVVRCCAAKRHTLVLTEDGDILTWGHRGVSPRKVVTAGVRAASTLGSHENLRFHKGYKDVLKPKIEYICAGAAHSSALTSTGVVLTWKSADPALQVQEVGGILAGKKVVSISAGKYRTAAVTIDGAVYMWEGRADFFPAGGRIAGSGSKKAQSPMMKARLYNENILGSPGGSSCGSYEFIGCSPGRAECGSYLESAYQQKMSRLGSSPSPHIGSCSSPSFVPRHHDTTNNAVSIYKIPGLKQISRIAVGEKHSLALQSWIRNPKASSASGTSSNR